MMRGRVVEAHQLFRLQRNHRVRLAIVIAKLDLVPAGSPALNDGANLAADQSLSRQVFQQRYHRMKFNLCHPEPSFYGT
jgi:hypothetical protein